jgi:glycosyltransferase involved in cell wall biosynthesis
MATSLGQEGVEPILVSMEDGPIVNRFRARGLRLEVMPGRDQDGRRALTDMLRSEGIRVCQSQGFCPSFAMAARQAGCATVWRLKGHVALSAEGDIELEQRLLALGSSLANVVVCPSRFLASQFDDLKHPDVRVIPNGVDLQWVDQELGGLGPLPRRGRRTVASVGNLVRSKNHEVFLEAMTILAPRYPDCDFAIFGQACEGPEYPAALEQLRRSLRLPTDTLRGAFQGSFVEAVAPLDILVFPFLHEGFANAAVEAMALGKPVVAARSGVLAEHVEDGEDGLLVAPQDPAALAEAIARLLEDPLFASRLGEAARRKAARLWDQRICAAAYAELYRELAEALCSKP